MPSAASSGGPRVCRGGRSTASPPVGGGVFPESMSSFGGNGEQFDVAVELRERVRRVTGRGVHQEVAVDLLRSVAVGHDPAVRVALELVAGLPGGRWTRRV